MRTTLIVAFLVMGLAIAQMFWIPVRSFGEPPQQHTAGQQTYHPAPTDEPNAESFWVRTFNDPVALFTAVLALTTVVLAVIAIVQIRFLIKADETTRKAANAADLSARAAVKIELPILRSYEGPRISRLRNDGAREQDDTGQELSGGLPVGRSYVDHINVTNRGRTVAVVTRVASGWTVARELPSEPVYAAIKIVEGGQALPADDDLRSVAVPREIITLTKDQASSVASGASTFWYYVQLTYIDFMDDTHEVAFCWQWFDQNRDRVGASGTSFIARLTDAPKSYAKPN